MGLLSLLIGLPLLGMVLTMFIPGKSGFLAKWITLGVSLVQAVVFFAAILPAYFAEEGTEAYRLVEQLQWLCLDLGDMGYLNIEYHLGLDGLGLAMVMLSVIIFPIAAVSSFKIEKRPKAYFSLFLLLNASVIGVFMALDFFLFYIFYELMLLPMFFLIGLWGGARREYAAIKFFLYTLFGSVFMLLIMVGLAFSVTDPELGGMLGKDVHTFDMLHMMDAANYVPDSIFYFDGTLLGMGSRNLAFLVLFIGFAIKIPAIPVHTWLPDAHVEAPTPVSVILAALLLKVGGYGILRICYGIFPEAGINYASFVAILGMVSILYGALVAMSQKDLKSLIAYSSISHMGFVLLGIASLDSTGVNGAVFQMFNHGIISAALFLLVGVLYDRTHDRQIENYRGLWGKMPRYTVFVIITFFASLGLPGLNGFVSEMLVFFGAFANQGHFGQWVAGLSVLGILLGAVYYLRTFRQMFFGKFQYDGPGQAEDLKDLDKREFSMLIPLTVLMIGLGLLPFLVLDTFDESVTAFTESFLEQAANIVTIAP